MQRASNPTKEIIDCAKSIEPNRDCNERIQELQARVFQFLEKFVTNDFRIRYFSTRLKGAVEKFQEGRLSEEKIKLLVDQVRRAVRSLEILSSNSKAAQLPNIEICETVPNPNFERALKRGQRVQLCSFAKEHIQTLTEEQVEELFEWGLENWEREILFPFVKKVQLNTHQLERLILWAFEYHDFEIFADDVILFYFDAIPNRLMLRIQEWGRVKSEGETKMKEEEKSFEPSSEYAFSSNRPTPLGGLIEALRGITAQGLSLKIPEELKQFFRSFDRGDAQPEELRVALSRFLTNLQEMEWRCLDLEGRIQKVMGMDTTDDTEAMAAGEMPPSTFSILETVMEGEEECPSDTNDTPGSDDFQNLFMDETS